MKSLKETWDQQSLTTNILMMPIVHRLGFSVYKVSLDSNMYFLSYSIFINSLQPDFHNITGFTQTVQEILRADLPDF